MIYQDHREQHLRDLYQKLNLKFYLIFDLFVQSIQMVLKEPYFQLLLLRLVEQLIIEKGSSKVKYGVCFHRVQQLCNQMMENLVG